MSLRRGVVSAGTFCVDFNKSIARWPSEDTSNEVLAIDRQGGGSGFNMAIDLKRLDPDFPVEAMGVVGDDDLGRFLCGECDAWGVELGGLEALPCGATMSVDAFRHPRSACGDGPAVGGRSERLGGGVAQGAPARPHH